MFAFLSNGPDHQIVEEGERTVSGVGARTPIKRPEEITTKGGPCKQLLILLGESDKITRLIRLFKEDLAKRYVYPEPSAGGEAEKADPMSLYADATVTDYLVKHPEDAPSFGLNGYRPGLEENDFTEREKEILNKGLEPYLMEKPEVGKHLGDKALAFRIQATGKKLEEIDKYYKKLLEKLPELKKRKENGFPLWARAYHSVRHGINKLLWWVRDNPKALMAVSTVLVLLKLGVVLFFIFEAMSGHKKHGHKENTSELMLQPQPAPRHRLQPPSYPPQAWPPPYSPQQYASQPYYPQPYVSLQSPVLPPYVEQAPTPLQVALSMPTT